MGYLELVLLLSLFRTCEQRHSVILQILYSLWVWWGAHLVQQVIRSQPVGQRKDKLNGAVASRALEASLRTMQQHLHNWGGSRHKLVLSNEDFPCILNDTLQTIKGIPSADDLLCLDDGACLTGEIISFYMSLLRTHAARKGNSRLAILDPQTLAQVELAQVELSLTGREESVQRSLKDMVFRWLVKHQLVKPDGDRVLIPCNQTEFHWMIAEAIVPVTRVRFYCSNGGSSSGLFHRPIEALFKTLSTFRGYERFGGPWSFENVPGVPQQSDGCSCGLYICAFADFLVDGKRPTGIGPARILSLRAAQRDLVRALQ